MIRQGESCRWCAICNNGNYEFCESCYEKGERICGHELKRLWVVQRPQYPFRWSIGLIVCSSCKTRLQPGELCYWCKVCLNGDLDLCHSCHSKRTYNCSHWPLPLCLIRKTNVPGAVGASGAQASPGATTNKANAVENTSRAYQALQLKDSLRDSIVTEKPNVRWDDVAGLESAKQELHEAVIFS